MKIFQTTVRIDAPPQRVWDVLVDVARWPEWTASVTEVKLVQGERLQTGAVVAIRQPKLKPALWTVTSMTPGREFIWETHSPGLYLHAVHTVMAEGSGSSVTLHLTYSGFLGPLMGWLLDGLTRRYIGMEAEGLKRRAEGLA
jgi:ribosome-associated toxin RatA of RatAB toxin-antitoxin module